MYDKGCTTNCIYQKKLLPVMLFKSITPTVETVGNVEVGLSITIANGFNRWNFNSAICRKPYDKQSAFFLLK